MGPGDSPEILAGRVDSPTSLPVHLPGSLGDAHHLLAAPSLLQPPAGLEELLLAGLAFLFLEPLRERGARMSIGASGK